MLCYVHDATPVSHSTCPLILGGELSCYEHDVIPVSKSGKVKYTTCQLQTSENAIVKGICFSPEKTAPLKRAMESKLSPIKVKTFEYDKFNNVVMKNTTSITTYDQPLPFNALPLQNRLLTINSLNSCAKH